MACSDRHDARRRAHRANLGRRVTGWGFVLFCAVSVTWIVSGLTSDAVPIVAMNGILLLINAWGVWQFLLSPRTRSCLWLL